MQYNIKNNKEFRYKSGEQLFAGLVIMESEEESYEILEIYEKYIDSVLDKYTEAKSRSENDIYSEVVESCATSIDGLDYDKASDILNAFTTFFLYDFSTEQCVISRNIAFEELNGTAIVSTKSEGIHLVEFVRMKDMGGDGNHTDEETDDDDNTTDSEPETDSFDGRGKDEKDEKDEEKGRTIVIDYKGILKKIIKIAAVLICAIVVFYGGKKLYDVLTDDSSTNTSEEGRKKGDEPICPPNTVVNLTVVNELATNGRLYAEEDSCLIIKYFVTSDMSINENTINWSQCPLLNRNDTLYPKRNCLVFIRATLRDGNEDIYRQEKANFDFNSYMEQLVMTNSNPKRTKEILSYSFNRPLTICYDNATEDVCEKETDKGIIDNLRTSLREGEYHIDSVAFYSNTDITKDILLKKYPQLKYIGCTSN